MGAYTMADGSMPFIGAEDLAQADKLMVEVVAALEKETDQPYRGFLYGQFMVTAKGPRVIEFNVRLGDPEGINEMTLFNGDAPLFLAGIAAGKIEKAYLSFKKQSSVVKYMVPADYPDNKPDPVDFNLDVKTIEQMGYSVIYASVRRAGEGFQTLGSRTLAVVGLGENPGAVSDRIEGLLAHHQPSVLRHRKDVGDGQILQNKVDRMAAIKGEH
jgi:phosphoribosylamine-glycine ligase